MIRVYNYIDTEKEQYDFSEKKVIIWGKAFSALDLFVELKARGVEVIGFTDTFTEEKNTMFAGLRVWTFDELQAMKGIVIYISTQNTIYLKQIFEKTDLLKDAVILARGRVYGSGEYDVQALSEKIRQDKEQISSIRNSLCDSKSIKTYNNLLEYRMSNQNRLIEEICETGHKQYFPEREILVPEDGEVFIDAGGYNGATSCEFAKYNSKYAQIYMMEPDEIMFAVAQEYIKLNKLQNVLCINKAAYSHTTELSFNSDFGSGSSRIDDTEGRTRIKTISIDEMLEGKECTFIKMDIEGAEMEALKGAKKSITKYHPKLAISIYHKEDDLWKIPYVIKQTWPEYKLYMRHYTYITTETVLYATV